MIQVLTGTWLRNTDEYTADVGKGKLMVSHISMRYDISRFDLYLAHFLLNSLFLFFSIFLLPVRLLVHGTLGSLAHLMDVQESDLVAAGFTV